MLSTARSDPQPPCGFRPCKRQVVGRTQLGLRTHSGASEDSCAPPSAAVQPSAETTSLCETCSHTSDIYPCQSPVSMYRTRSSAAEKDRRSAGTATATPQGGFELNAEGCYVCTYVSMLCLRIPTLGLCCATVHTYMANQPLADSRIASEWLLRPVRETFQLAPVYHSTAQQGRGKLARRVSICDSPAHFLMGAEREGGPNVSPTISDTEGRYFHPLWPPL